MKKRNFFVLFGLVIIILLCFFWSHSFLNHRTASVYEPAAKISKQDKIWLITDIHYLSAKLFDAGDKFAFIKKTAAGKDLNYPKERMEALVWQVQKKRPGLLIVSGDLTLNGEKESALELAEYFKQIEELGTQVLVIPGNHDVADGWARKYQGAEAYETAQILPDGFSQIFSEMGYADAFSRDRESLSYAYKAYQDLWVVMIDSNKYINGKSASAPATNGYVKDETLNWLQRILKQAKQQNARVIPVMHHNLVNHNTYLNKGFTVDNAAQVRQLFAKNQLNVVLSGHIHAQDIGSAEANGQKIYDITTGSFAIAENNIGELTILPDKLSYEVKPLNVSQWAEKTRQTKTDLLNYTEYSTGLFLNDGQAMGYTQMMEENWYDEVFSDQVADFVGRMNLRFFEGKDHPNSSLETASIKNEAGYQIIAAHSKNFLLPYMDSIIEDHDEPDTKITIPFRKAE